MSPCAVCNTPARAPVCGQVAWISKLSTEIYCKIDCVWLMIFLLTALAWAQPKPLFPDDTQDPKQAGGAELLEAVCPGHVVSGKDIACKETCPESSGFKDDKFWDWTLVGVTRGHFLSPQSDDAALAMVGCEGGYNRYGGTILLTRNSGKWTMLWYKGGVQTVECHRGKLTDGREILICLGGYGGQGNVWTDLYIVDLLMPLSAESAGKEGTALSAFDNSSTCGWNPQDEEKPVHVTSTSIESVRFQTAPDGTFRGVSVFGRHGERDMTVAQVKTCDDERIPGRPHRGLNFNPPTKPYRVDFKFDGKQMVRVGESPGAPK